MSWGDLLRALADEAEREAGTLRSGAEQEAARALELAAREASAAREATLEAARERAAASERRALAEVRRQRDAALLVAAREELDRVRAEALERARAATPRALPALVEAIAREAGPRPAEWTVDAGLEEALRSELARLGRAEPVGASAAPRGGPEATVDGRVVLDATAAARLERAWPELEPRVCAVLLAEAADVGGV